MPCLHSPTSEIDSGVMTKGDENKREGARKEGKKEGTDEVQMAGLCRLSFHIIFSSFKKGMQNPLSLGWKVDAEVESEQHCIF